MGLAGSTWSGHEFCRTGTQIFPYMSVADFARCGDEFGLECAREWVYCPHSKKGGIMPCQSHPLLCCECCAVARKLFSPRSKKKIVTPCSPPTPRCPGDYLRHRHAPGGSLSHASPPNRFHREADLHLYIERGKTGTSRRYVPLSDRCMEALRAGPSER